MKTYYELLSLERTADPEEVKRAFRREIALYHPDKVQHLGREFQEIAATRAAELTEAYRILMDPAARSAYDSSLQNPGAAARPASAAAGAAATAAAPAPSAPTPAPVPEMLRQTRDTVSQFVTKATLGRLHQAVLEVFGTVDTVPAHGFDAAYVAKSKGTLFKKADQPIQLLARVVSQVDRAAVEEAWPLAQKAGAPDRLLCVMLLGLGLAPSREIAAGIAEQRRRSRGLAPVIVPVDTRDWEALVPPETPQGVRKLLDRLKLGA